MNWIEKDRKYIWHPFTPQKERLDPIFIERGKGSLLYDADQREYIDAVSSWWVTVHGHAHPYIAEKLYQQALQLEQVIFAGFTHKPAIELAERLITLLPEDFTRIFYSDNGSTSTEVSLKMAIQYWWNQSYENGVHKGIKRNKIIAFKNSYHGDTFGAMSVSDRGVFTMAFHDLLFEVLFIDTPEHDNIKQTKALIEEYGHEVAAFIYEPLVQGAGGMKMYEAPLLDELLDMMKEAGIICIADEVMTGFGRTGKLFASDHMRNKPDIICLSKGLTGGTMALGVTACTDRIYNAYVNDDKLKTFFHGHSFTANPLACTAAVASLDLIEQNSVTEKIEWISAQHAAFATKLAAREARKGFSVKNIRTQGTIIAFEIDKGKDEYLNNISQVITQKCMAQGVYIRPLGNTVYLMPPYCITAEELIMIYEVLLNVLNE